MNRFCNTISLDKVPNIFLLKLLLCLAIPITVCFVTTEAVIDKELFSLGRDVQISIPSIRFGCLPSVWITLCKKLCRLQPGFCLNAIRAQTTTTTAPTTTGTPESTTSSNDLCNEPFSCVGKPNGQYENPFNCSDTITCDNGGIPTITRNCPKESWFNLDRQLSHCQSNNSDGRIQSKPKQAPCVNLCNNEPPTAIPSTSPSTPTTPTTPATSSTASTPSSRFRPNSHTITWQNIANITNMRNGT